MALSNYNTLAVEFEITERTLSLGDASDAAREAEAAIDAKLAPLAALASSDNERESSEVMEDHEYHQFVRDAQESRITHDVKTRGCDGSFQSPSTDLSVDIYKNWIYLRSPSMWQPGGSFVEPTIMQITEGELKIGGLQIRALPAPQDGIGVVAYTSEYGDDERGNYIRHRGMIGVGVYAYEDIQEPDESGRDGLAGVLPETLQWLQARAGNEFPDFLRSLNLTSSEHFNQGDAFFAGEFGIETPVNPAGETSEPFFIDAVKGLNTRLAEEQ